MPHADKLFALCDELPDLRPHKGKLITTAAGPGQAPPLAQLAAAWPEGPVSALFTKPREATTPFPYDMPDPRKRPGASVFETRNMEPFGTREGIEYSLEGVVHAIEAVRHIALAQLDQPVRLLITE